MLISRDTRDKKLKKWVTPTLTRINQGGDTCGGVVSGATEGGHVVGFSLHFSGSGNTPAGPSSDRMVSGTAAASS